MTTFTKEQLIKRLEEQMSSARYALGFVQDSEILRDIEMDLRLAEIALASLTAEPALYAAEETLAYANMGELHLTCLSEPMGDAVIPLYATPPAPVVPDRSMFETWWESQNGSPFDSWDSLRTTDGYCDDGIDGQFEAWNACRAAMLERQSVDHVDQASVTTIQTAPALDSVAKNAESLPSTKVDKLVSTEFPGDVDLSTICAEAYQVVGVMAEALGVFDDTAVQKVMDNLSQQKLIHRDVLPFSLPAAPQQE